MWRKEGVRQLWRTNSNTLMKTSYKACGVDFQNKKEVWNLLYIWEAAKEAPWIEARINSLIKWENRDVLSVWEGVMLDITCAFSSSSDEDRMAEYWISICDFLEDITYKKGKVPTLWKWDRKFKRRVVEDDWYSLRTQVWRSKIIIVLKGHTLWTSGWDMCLLEVVQYHM